MNIHVLKQLRINDGILYGRDTAKGETFLSQGDADGACGPYCVFMAMNILGYLDRNTITSLDDFDKRTRLGRFFNLIPKNSALLRDGTFKEQLQEIAEAGFRDKITVETTDASGKQCIKFIVDHLQQDRPVIFSIHGKGFSHWVLAVGVKANSSDDGRIFILDPAALRPIGTYWNGYVTTSGKGGFYEYCSRSDRNLESNNARYSEAIAFI